MMGDALKRNDSLTKLILASSKRGGKKIMIVECEKKFCKCTDNNCGNEGCIMMGEALKCNSTLTQLDLWRNEIGVEGAKMLSVGLERNSTLTSLNLGIM